MTETKKPANNAIGSSTLLDSIPRMPQRQDSTNEQLSDLAEVDLKLGMYDALVRPVICPECRGRCGVYKPDEGRLGTFYPCKTCGGNGSIPNKRISPLSN